MRLRAARLQMRWTRVARRILDLEQTVYVAERVGEYRAYWQAAAQLIGAEFQPLTRDIWEVRCGERRTRIASYVVAADDAVTLRVAGDKELCHRMAREQGVPVPAHEVFTLSELSRARAFWEREGPPLVVKPVAGSSSGLGIGTHLRTWREIERAAVLASLHGSRIMLEKMVPGESCRLLFLDGRFLHAVRRRGVRVRGDGRSSVRQLLIAAGAPCDLTAELTLHAQGLSPATVPAARHELVARCLPAAVAGTRELRTIYDETITAAVAPELIDEVAPIVRALGSRFAGVDVITNDPGRSLADAGGVFLEINTTPGIHHHYHTPEEHRDHPVAVAVLRSLLAQPAGIAAAPPADRRDIERRTTASITKMSESRKEAV
jgi:cyanophycin synthetase